MPDLGDLELEFICDNKRHMVCRPHSVENLHRMAEVLGIKRCWYHLTPYPHYDMPKKRVAEITGRCTMVNPSEIVLLAKGRKA